MDPSFCSVKDHVAGWHPHVNSCSPCKLNVSYAVCILFYRLSRYWLKGEKAGTSDVFAVLPGFPDNVRTNEKGEFWVAIHCRLSMYTHLTSRYFRLRKFLLKLPIPAKYHFLLQIGGRPHAVIIKYSPDGELLEILEDSQGKVVRAVSEVEEKDGKLWIGSVLMPFIAVY